MIVVMIIVKTNARAEERNALSIREKPNFILIDTKTRSNRIARRIARVPGGKAPAPLERRGRTPLRMVAYRSSSGRSSLR